MRSRLLTLSLALVSGVAFAAAPIAPLNATGLTVSQRFAQQQNQISYLRSQLGQVSTLNTKIDQLRGQVEDLSHQQSLMQGKLNAQTKRMSQLTHHPIAQPTTKNRVMAMPVKDTYDYAYKLMLQKRYDMAISNFEGYLRTNPKSARKSNAHYWLGELYLAKGNAGRAEGEFHQVVNFRGLKTPDALLQLGNIALAKGQRSVAKKTFRNLIISYPGTTAANQAQKRLKNRDLK